MPRSKAGRWALVLLGVAYSGGVRADPGLQLTLAQALSRGWQANPGLEQARANVERAEALVVQSRASWLPTLNAGGSFTQLEGDRGLGDRVTTAASTLNGTIVLQVPILVVPRWLATGQAADARDVAQLDIATFQRAIASVVGRAWLQVRLQERVLEVATRALQASNEQLSLARARSEGGLGTRLEIARSEREQADNQSRLALAEADLAVARDTLGALLGEAQAVGIVGEPELPLIPEVLDLSRRPDLRAAEARVALAERRVDESWTDYLPTLSAALGPTAQTPAYDPTPGLGFLGQVLLTLPLYDGGARHGLHDERLALYHQAVAQREELRLNATAQLHSAQVQLERRRIATESSLRSAALAEEAFQLAKLAVAEGISTNLELIEAEQAARDAGTNAKVVENAAEIAQLELLIAVGALVPEEAR